MDPAVAAYFAGVIDTLGVIRTRKIGGSTAELPYVAISGPHEGLLRYLGDLTDVKVVITRRQYTKAGCSLHCAEKHLHVTSLSGRWSLSGVKATVLLHTVKPFLRLQADEAENAIRVGLEARYKPATVEKMRALGWNIPEFGGRRC